MRDVKPIVEAAFPADDGRAGDDGGGEDDAMRTLVLPREGRGRLRPVDAAGVHVTGGFWAERLATNRERSIPHGLAQLEASGALGNFRHAARGSGRYVGGLDDAGITFPFLDSDVYKWLEAVGWELGRADDAELAARAGEVIGVVEAAQRPDGYLNTFVQLSGREPYTDLQWGHELYCVGHLTQAAVAWQRSLGDGRLLAVAERAIGHIEQALGEDGRAAIDGHPEIEMALVELFRTTGEERYLRLAALLVERRGQGLLGVGRMGTSLLAGPRPGARGADDDRARGPPAVPRLRRRRRRDRDRRRRSCSARSSVAGRTCGRRARTSRARSARVTATRPSATPSSCHRTVPTRRPAPRSPA